MSSNSLRFGLAIFSNRRHCSMGTSTAASKWSGRHRDRRVLFRCIFGNFFSRESFSTSLVGPARRPTFSFPISSKTSSVPTPRRSRRLSSQTGSGASGALNSASLFFSRRVSVHITLILHHHIGTKPCGRRASRKFLRPLPGNC